MSWYQPRQKNTPYNYRLVWGNDNDIRFFMKPNEQKDFKTRVETSRKDCKSLPQKTTNKEEEQKKRRREEEEEEEIEERPPQKKKTILKKETKDKTARQSNSKPKTKVLKKAPVSAGEITRDNFI